MKEFGARQSLGQIFALRLPERLDSIDIDRFPVANYIVFKEALGPTLEASRDRILRAKAHLKNHGIEPLFMMDEEGGRVTQISDFFPSAPSPRAVSSSLTPDEAGLLYKQVATLISGMGIDMNLFPCVDVNTEPLNPIIGTRSFGQTAEDVRAFARTAISCSRRHLACVAKHFPGHGMTRLDSHLGKPAVIDSREIMAKVHIQPFREAMSAGADGIMVSHCLYGALQPDGLPASLSEHIVATELRQKCAYNGLVLTDSLDMQAITQDFRAPEAALLALRAGCDILLYTEYSDRFEKTFETLVDMLLMYRLKAEPIGQSIGRRNQVLARIKAVRGLGQAFDERTYLSLVERVRAASVRVDDPGGLLPLRCKEASVVSTSPAVVEKLKHFIPTLTEPSVASDVSGRPLILWIMEPLAIRQSSAVLREMVAASDVSVFATTYEPVAKVLAGCRVRIVTCDSSPHMEDLIMQCMFGT